LVEFFNVRRQKTPGTFSPPHTNITPTSVMLLLTANIPVTEKAIISGRSLLEPLRVIRAIVEQCVRLFPIELVVKS
jgi:hypothetical protein